MSTETAYLPRIDVQASVDIAGQTLVSGGRILVDLDALAQNWRMLQAMVQPGCTVAAVVKADGYGLGMARVAGALAEAGCRWFFVALPSEGVALAETLLPAFPDVQVAVLSGALPDSADLPMLAAPLIPVLNSLKQLRQWRERAAGRPAMLHIESGMVRLGLPETETTRLAADPSLLEGVPLAGVMSHLACADQADHPMNESQRLAFERLARVLPTAPLSLAASSGTFLGAGYHYDMVRVGAALYGINPIPGRPNPMRPVVTLQARIIQIRALQPGEAVGYGATWRASRETRVATLALGYADGVLRSAGNSAVFRVGGADVPVIGRVSMDLITIDVTELEGLKPGDHIDLVGRDYDLDDLARDSGTLAYEALVRLGSRLPRTYLTAG